MGSYATACTRPLWGMACAALLGLTGCNAPLLGAMALVQPAQAPRPLSTFAVGLHDPESLIKTLTPVLDTGLAPESATAGAGPSIRLMGRAQLPQVLKDAANVQDGRVTGSQVLIEDVLTGRTIGRAVTYYDGSFRLDIPLAQGQRAVLVTLDLVDKAQPQHAVALTAPLILKAGSVEQQVNLSPGSTMLSSFLIDLATLQGGGLLPEAMQTKPEGPSLTLGGLIASFDDEDQRLFAQLAESSPELRGADSVQNLQKGFSEYIRKLRGAVAKSK